MPQAAVVQRGVGVGLDREDLRIGGAAPKHARVDVELAEQPADRLVGLAVELLIAEDQHVMGQERVADGLGERLVARQIAKVEIEHLGADGGRERLEIERGVHDRTISMTGLASMSRSVRPVTASARRVRLSPNTLGCVFMVLGSLGYVVNDAFVRMVTDDGLDVYQVLFLRGVMMSAIFVAVSAARGDTLRREHVRGPIARRVAAEVAGTALFFAALVRMDFANAQTILMLVPFAVTLIAALRLAEPVGALRYAVVAAGFVGVLIVVRPAGDGFTGWSIVVAVSAGFLVVREFATRRIDPSISALPVATLTAIAITAMMGLISAFTGWGPITGRSVGLMVLACVCLVGGYVFTIQTVRVGDLSVSAPFRYTTLVGAVVLGRIAFDERIDAWTIVGCGVIIGAGVVSIRSDRAVLRDPTGG